MLARRTDARHADAMPPRTQHSIRPAVRADVATLLALEEATFTADRISRARWLHHIASATASVLVHGQPGAIDAAAVVLYRRNSRRARLYSLAVHSSTRGSGLGAALLAAAETDARANGCTAMHLEVRTGNPVAIALYERHGYTRYGRLAHFYEDGADAWCYAKPLAALHK